LLLHHEHAVADVLPPHADHIRASLCSVEQQREREARLATDGMVRLKLRNLVIGPRMESVAFDLA
jgi:hypothetical protein